MKGRLIMPTVIDSVGVIRNINEVIAGYEPVAKTLGTSAIAQIEIDDSAIGPTEEAFIVSPRRAARHLKRTRILTIMPAGLSDQPLSQS